MCLSSNTRRIQSERFCLPIKKHAPFRTNRHQTHTHTQSGKRHSSHAHTALLPSASAHWQLISFNTQATAPGWTEGQTYGRMGLLLEWRLIRTLVGLFGQISRHTSCVRECVSTCVCVYEGGTPILHKSNKQIGM